MKPQYAEKWEPVYKRLLSKLDEPEETRIISQILKPYKASVNQPVQSFNPVKSGDKQLAIYGLGEAINVYLGVLLTQYDGESTVTAGYLNTEDLVLLSVTRVILSGKFLYDVSNFFTVKVDEETEVEALIDSFFQKNGQRVMNLFNYLTST